MVNLNDLMKGNYVSLLNKDVFFLIEEVRKNSVCGTCKNVIHWHEYGDQYLMPIPLTFEVIMFRLQFDCDGELSYSLHGHTLRKMNNGTFMYYVKQTGSLRPVNYVHEVQNLYYILEQKHLIIRL